MTITDFEPHQRQRLVRELHCRCGGDVIADVTDRFLDSWLAEHRPHDPAVRDPRHHQPDLLEMLEATP